MQQHIEVKFKNKLVWFNNRLESDSTAYWVEIQHQIEQIQQQIQGKFNRKWKGDLTPNGRESQQQIEVRINTKLKGESTPNGSEIQHQMEVRFNN